MSAPNVTSVRGANVRKKSAHDVTLECLKY